MEDNKMQEDFNDYVQRKRDLSEDIVFKRSIAFLLYLLIPMCFGLFLFIFGIVKGDVSFVFGIFFIAISTVGLVFYLKMPKIMARTNGETITFYRRKQQPLTVKADEIDYVEHYTMRNGFIGAVNFSLKDGTRLRYLFVGNVSDTSRRFDAWKNYQYQKQIEQLRSQTLDGGYDYTDVPDGEDNKNI